MPSFFRKSDDDESLARLYYKYKLKALSVTYYRSNSRRVDYNSKLGKIT